MHPTVVHQKDQRGRENFWETLKVSFTWIQHCGSSLLGKANQTSNLSVYNTLLATFARRRAHQTNKSLAAMSNNTRSIRKLVINGDDFGYCPERNRGIIECFQSGAITSASLMVNGVFANQAVELAKANNLPLGLHLNLTEGTAVSKELINKNSSTLLGSDGFFHGKFAFREALKKEHLDMEEVRMEIRAQILRFRNAVGHMPLYVDGHQHCHVLSGIRNVFAEVLQDYGVCVTRLPVEFGLEKCLWLDKASMAFFKGVEEDAMEAKNLWYSHGIRHPHGYIGISTMGANMSVERIQSAVSASIKTAEMTSQVGSTLTFELMTHPGYPSVGHVGGCGQGPDEFACSADRVHEMDVLKTEKLRQFFRTNDVQLCTFQEVSADCKGAEGD